MDIIIGKELMKAYDLIDTSKTTNLTADDLYNARYTACVAISLYRALYLSGADVGPFSKFYADQVNADRIRAEDAYVNDKSGIAKSYGKTLVVMKNPKAIQIRSLMNNTDVNDGVVRRKGHNFNVFENVRTGGVFVADEGSIGATGKSIEQRLGNSVVDYFYFVR